MGKLFSLPFRDCRFERGGRIRRFPFTGRKSPLALGRRLHFLQKGGKAVIIDLKRVCKRCGIEKDLESDFKRTYKKEMFYKAKNKVYTYKSVYYTKSCHECRESGFDQRKYLRKYTPKWMKKQSGGLTDSYVKMCIVKEYRRSYPGVTLRYRDIPDELVELKRLVLRLHRIRIEYKGELGLIGDGGRQYVKYYSSKVRQNLGDSYIKALIKDTVFYYTGEKISSFDIPDEMIELRRSQVQLRRLLKKTKRGIYGSNQVKCEFNQRDTGYEA